MGCGYLVVNICISCRRGGFDIFFHAVATLIINCDALSEMMKVRAPNCHQFRSFLSFLLA